MDTKNLIAIDTHTHLEVSCRNPFDNYGEEYDRAADKYFRSSRRPTMDETIAFYREKKIGFVNFTVDAESQMGRAPHPERRDRRRGAGQQRHHDRVRQHRPAQGQDGRRARRAGWSRNYGVKGFKFHPTVQGFEPADKMAWPIYEVINEYKLPAVFHSGHSGIGSGMRCGGGLRLQNSQPDAARGRGDRLPRHADHHRAPVAGRGRTRRSRWRCTSPTSGSTCRAGARSTFRRSSCSTRTRC